MSMLAFFPWFTIAAPTSIAGFVLTPHRLGSSPDPQAKTIDSILEAYVEPGGKSIGSATVIHFAERELTAELSQEDRAALFEFAEVVAFAGLARRTFFGFGGYVNRDQFALIIQSFVSRDPRSVAITARRRDGHQLSGYPPGDYRTTRPPHVSNLTGYSIDVGLVGAVVRALGADMATPLGEPISSFNTANTDSNQTPVQHEVVAMIGAFERLVDSSGMEKDLVERLLKLVAPFLSTARKCKRLSSINRFEASKGSRTPISTSITEAWIRDFFRVRNAFGHGRRAPDRPAYWTPEAHLLYGAYLFPLAALVRLKAAGLYELSTRDTDALLAFAYFVSLRNPFAHRRSRAAKKRDLWNHALEAASNESRRAMIAKIVEKVCGPEPK
jgi:hypothetical protein